MALLESNDFRETTQLKQYSRKMLGLLKIKYPDIEEEKLTKILLNVVKEKFKDAPLNYNAGDLPMSAPMNLPNKTIHSFDNWIVNEKPIITGSGSIYLRQDQFENVNAAMLDEFAINRKKDKNEMFKHVNDIDSTIHDIYDINQRNWKVQMNSYYGLLNANGSQFTDPYSGHAVTASGVDIITTSIALFEKMVSNNIYIRNTSSLYSYINNIITEEYKNFDMIIFEKEISREDLAIRLMSYLTFELTEMQEETLVDFLNKLDGEDIYKLYYKNNLIDFFNETNFLNLYVKPIFNDKDFREKGFVDANKPPESIKGYLEDTWSMLSEFVYYDFQEFDRIENTTNSERQAVLITDTDSNFIYLKLVLDAMRNVLGSELISDDNMDNIIASLNIIMYNLTKAISRMLYKLSRESGIPESHASVIEMKNEFLSKRIMITPNKKQYAQVIVAQEGNKYDIPKMDMKGLSIRKVSTNSKVRNVVSDILENDILKSNEIDYRRVISRYKDLELDIYDSLSNGSMEFLKVLKANGASSYKKPFSQLTFRGSMAWNILEPEKRINLPDKVAVLKMNISTWNEIEDKIKDKVVLDRFKTIWNDDRFKIDNAINVIAIPTSEKVIPEYLRPLIDIESIVSDNMSDTTIILESLGFEILNISDFKFPTNMISL